MNNQEYEQKKAECWRSVNNNTRDFGIISLRCFTAIFDCAYALGKEEKESEREDNPQARAWEALTPAMRTYCCNIRRTSHDGNVEDLLDRLFGSKCLPDDSSKLQASCRQVNVDSLPQNPTENCDNKSHISADCNKPAEPEFKVGDIVRFKYCCTPHRIDGFKMLDGVMLYQVGEIWAEESDLEPYTEPKETKAEEVADKAIKPVAEQFDNILRKSLSKERRLTIATQIMSGILSNQRMMNNLAYGETTAEGVVRRVVNATTMYTDALIAEAEKEDCYSPELTDKLKGE